MKKNTMMRIASVLLIAVLMTTCVISGTFAKYVSDAIGTGSADIAKWSFTVGGTDIATATQDFEFSLIDTIKDENGTDSEDDVATGKIAPGTSGSFAITVQNLSEVTAKYSITFVETANAANIPIQYKVGAGEWQDDIAALSISDEDTGLAVGSAAETITIYWRWAYETLNGDTVDTDAGIGIYDEGTYQGAFNVQVKATITATQVN